MVIHTAIAIRKYVQNRQIKAIYKHVHLDSDLDKIWISVSIFEVQFISYSFIDIRFLQEVVQHTFSLMKSDFFDTD